MKFLFVLLLISISTITLCQTHNAKFYLKPIVGVNLHSDQLETIAANKPIKVLNSGLLGLEVGHKKSPFILRYQHLQYMSLQVNSDSIFLGNNNIGEIWLNDEIGLFYRFKKTTFGLSHYWKKRENWITHNFLLVRDFINKGFNLSVSYPVEWFDVELRAQVQYYDVFAALVGSANYSLSFLYKFDKASKQAHQSNFVHLNALVGVRLFPHNVKPSGNEFFVKSFGIAPQLGLEFLFDKYNVSFNLEKDWWLSFNAGSQIRDVKGLVYNTFVGIKYHQKLKNLRHIRYGFGGNWTEDGEYQSPNLPPKHKNKDGELYSLSNYQVRGFAASISYEILPNTDIELKTMLPTAGEKVFYNRSRTSIGLIYRFNPFVL